MAWKAGAGSGDAPFTIDLDSTICETYGLAKEGARHHGYTGARGYHPLLAVAAGTGDVLMSRLREGRANTARGAAHFLRETTEGPAGSSLCGPTAASIPTPWSPSAAGWMSASPSPSASTKACTISSRRYPKMPGRRFLTGWTVPLLWPRPPTPPSRVSPTPHRCGSSSGGCRPRPAPNWLSSPPTGYHGFITDRDGETLELEATIAATEIENAIRDLKYGVGLNHLPSGRFAANGAWLARDGPQPGPLDRSAWVSRS